MTENLTSGGFFCLCREAYLRGDELQATLDVPSQYGNGRQEGRLTLQCQVEVVRIDEQTSGIACRIKDYTVIGGSAIAIEIRG